MVADFLEANPNDCGSCRASSQAYDVVKAVHLQASSAIDTSYKPYTMLERRNFTAQVRRAFSGKMMVTVWLQSGYSCMVTAR